MISSSSAFYLDTQLQQQIIHEWSDYKLTFQPLYKKYVCFFNNRHMISPSSVFYLDTQLQEPIIHEWSDYNLSFQPLYKKYVYFFNSIYVCSWKPKMK